jgi:hypothetical protein
MSVPALKLVDPSTGELIDPKRCVRCERMEAEAQEMDRKFKGSLLEIRKLRSDKQAELWGHPDRPKVQLLHTAHAAATKASPHTTRTKALDPNELETALRCLKRLGLRRCLAAVVGITWDPSFSKPRRNGTRECFNTFELCFRSTAKAISFAERAPLGWSPNAERLADLAGLSVTQVEDWLVDARRPA